MAKQIRILFIADTHLGFDYTFNARIERRRRGNDFFGNYELALQPAFKKKVDIVVHGGDLLFRSKVPSKLVWMAFQPLLKIADLGIPIYLVPGNHERSAIPYELLGAHPLIHIFREPQTYLWQKDDIRFAFSGFPCDRDEVRDNFRSLLSETQWNEVPAEYRFLCLHQAVEGAQVGVQNYTFRYNSDVIKGNDLPPEFTATLTGHIHRAQVLSYDLQGNPLPCPVFYPGSIERTDFAEMNEQKGYYILKIDPQLTPPLSYEFIELPTRPMFKIEVPASIATEIEMETFIRESVENLPPDAIIKYRFSQSMDISYFPCLHANNMREVIPGTMNYEISTRRNYA